MKKIIKFRADESKKFDREITKSKKIPLINITKELLEKDISGNLKYEIFRTFQENYEREYRENFTYEDVLKRLEKILSE